MADIQIISPFCEPKCKKKHKKHKKKRKHHEHHEHHHEGTGLLKFSGAALIGVEGAALISHLADPGIGTNADTPLHPENYPFAVKRRVHNLAVNVQFYTVQIGGTIVAQLFKNGVATGFTITYVGGETGVKVFFGHVTYDIGDTLDLQVTTTGITDTDGVNMSATVGLDS